MRSYLDRHPGVSSGRALPDVRDQPVHRRALARHRLTSRHLLVLKSSRVVGEVMGDYHPTATPRSTTPSRASCSPGRCAIPRRRPG